MSGLRCRRAAALLLLELCPKLGPEALFGLFAPSEPEQVAEIEHCGAEHDRMNIAGKMKSTVGKSILIGAFIAFSSAAAWRLMRVSTAWTREDAAERDAELVGLDDRARRTLTARASRRASTIFFSASWRASPMRISLSASANSSIERAVHVLGQLRDRAVEAHARPRR